MAIDTSTPQSPGWWLARLHKRLADRRGRYQRLDDYLTGEACAPQLATRATREAYARLLRMSGLNMAELVVEAPRERMQVLAFRTSAADDENGDAEAGRIWQANSLDADSSLVHRTSLGLSMSYVMVGGVDPEIGAPLITIEDPREVIVEHDPRRKRKPLAAAKFYRDDVLGVDRAELYLPGLVFRAHGEPSAQPSGFNDGAWSWDSLEPDRLPAGVVPVVAFPNRVNTFGRPMAEFEAHVQLIDRINHQILERLVIQAWQAFRQRAMKGGPTHTVDEETGDQVPVNYGEVFESSPGSVWKLPADAEMWESTPIDLTPVRMAIRDDVQNLAAVTRTPLFYLAPDAANGSAEGASLAREGLVFKTTDKLAAFAESWKRVMSLAFTFAGDQDRAPLQGLQVVWASPERFSLAERYDAAVKAQAAGVPWRTVMSEVLQFKPDQIEQMAAERAADAFLAAALAPAPTAEQVPGA